MLSDIQATTCVVRKRDGKQVPFDKTRIKRAITGAFLETIDSKKIEDLAEEKQQLIDRIVADVVEHIEEVAKQEIDVEYIQDVVEQMLMRHGQYQVARRYIVYREAHTKARELTLGTTKTPVTVQLPSGKTEHFSRERLYKTLSEACHGLQENCSPDELLHDICTQIYNGITPEKIQIASILTARTRIEQEPDYDHVASRLLLRVIYKEVGEDSFQTYIKRGIEIGLLDPKLGNYKLDILAKALNFKRDQNFRYMGMQTLYDRYLLHNNNKRLETPQFFWMRVAMGLALNETDKEQWAIIFYELLSSFHYLSATPTLFHSGTMHPQLSSCYLTTVQDDLESIFKSIQDNALLSKWAGGLGNDWTNIRSTGSFIKGTSGKSQGLIPFLKVVNDTAVAVNQGGKRKGAVCVYIELWHLDYEEFLDLRKNTGDDRRRAHDMNTATWIPDLFMKRVEADQEWTLFSPDETPELHDLYGKAFEEKYAEYEQRVEEGKIALFKKISAKDLWKKMLSRLFETGHPWMTWKDPSNIRSTQAHVGVVHSSNLCTEILLNTCSEETAVCNLGSVNLAAHIVNGKLDIEMLERTIITAIRMLDNVIDINYYPTEEAKRSNLRHRPIGLGMMGFQDALHQLGISYSSEEAVTFADYSMEVISYYAILASTMLAAERGTYSTYPGSKWDQGLLPIDTVALLENAEVDTSSTLEWDKLREAVKTNGMRNSNVMAIAPTATISHIVGVSQSIEPNYSNLFVKSNLSGEFTSVNRWLVRELKKEGLWNSEMLDLLKYHDGSVQEIEQIPESIKKRFKTAFEIEPFQLIECAARRQKWIDMGQSLNLYIATPSGKLLDKMYRRAWRKGLKTTYYLRSKASTNVEKSTLDINKFGIQPKWMKSQSPSRGVNISREECDINGDCEACQ